MAVGVWTLTNNAKMRLAKGNWNVDAATLKCALVTSASNLGATTTTHAGVTGELAAANGYATGGIAVDLAYAGAAAVTASFIANPVWTASGAGLTARQAELYEVGGDTLGYLQLDTTAGGTDVVVSSPNTLTIDSDGTPSPVYTVS